MNIPEGLLYTREHEWVKIESDMATIGITDYAQFSLGDITFVQLPAPGADIQKSSVIATVESVKAASDVYAPLSGKVARINEEIVANPEIVNQSPYEKAWFAVIKTRDLSEKQGLLDQYEYKKYLDELNA
ncbi:MAG: glycine cleavage system protein GcvH [Candidatus Omnitrophica bacterium]|nr:glycine cleavage system protein GcvH [Candidatus Omnitrophota bacterium]